MIKFKEIHVSYEGKQVFEDFSMEIKKGEKILLKGPSGRGKSTLLKLLMGFKKVDKGKIFLEDKLLSKKTIEYFRSNISYVSQQVDLRNEIVWDLIKEIYDYKNNKKLVFVETEIIDKCNYFDLDNSILYKKVYDLSGGEKQRIGFIISTLLDRPIWLLDEVTSALDADLKEKVVNYVINSDKTVLIVSHDKIWSENNLIRVQEL